MQLRGAQQQQAQRPHRALVCVVLLRAAPATMLLPLHPMCRRITVPATADEVFYFAYGSNMAPAVLTGRRRVRPRQSLPCSVPSHELTFDVYGMPYVVRQHFKRRSLHVLQLAYMRVC